tara:strand:- start:13577 stop:15475 length:1899 start_codon:yes stop_codon:yes gene_type:complete
MCGIYGYMLASAGDCVDLDPVSKSLKHRGPDGSGTFYDESAGVGLGHVRLSIIDLSDAGHQPMVSESRDFTLTYNGEIYNFREHRDKLKAQGVEFDGHCDTEVLLKLIEVHGCDVLPELNGMFGFAFYQKSTETITLVRDALGVKPLYYSINADGFFFSSEVSGLLEMGVKGEGADPVVVARYNTFLWNPGTELPSANIKKLGPGEAMIIKKGKVAKHWRWYQSPTLMPKASKMKVDAVVSETENQLRKAVHRQMVADVPVGAFLSGGLDSSAVVAFAKELSSDIRCFTIESPGDIEAGMVEDLPYARKVADHLDVPLDIVQIDPDSMVRDLENMVLQLEEPLADPASLNVMYICRAAREKNIKVLLSGSGGDDLFTGYRRHQAVDLDRYIQYIPSSIRIQLEKLSKYADQRRPIQRRLAKFLKGIGLNGDQRLVQYFHWIQRPDLERLFSSEFRDQVTRASLDQPMLDYISDMEDRSSINRILALEQRFFLTEHNLAYTDKMSMAESVEVRVPFLDSELINYAASIPPGLKQRGREGKWVLKKAMEAYLPHEVIYRPKAGFGAPLRRWICGDLRGAVLELLSEKSLRERGLFDPASVHKLIDDDYSGKIDASYTILSLMCTELWCRNFIDC